MGDMIQNRSFKFSRVSTILISIALLLVTLLSTAMASGPSVNEILSSGCEVPFRLSVSDSIFDSVGMEIDARLAGDLAAAECAVNELLSGAVFLGIAQDSRLAFELARAKDAADDLVEGAAQGVEFFGGLYNIRLAEEIAGAKDAAADLFSGAALSVAFDSRLAEEIAGARVAADELVEGAALGIALDYRAAQNLAAAKIAAAELVRGQLSEDHIARMITAQEAREAIMLAEILELQDSISLR